jgi:GTP:adenosylcobinamide-phosphate guanylyltransferase
MLREESAKFIAMPVIVIPCDLPTVDESVSSAFLVQCDVVVVQLRTDVSGKWRRQPSRQEPTTGSSLLESSTSYV